LSAKELHAAFFLAVLSPLAGGPVRMNLSRRVYPKSRQARARQNEEKWKSRGEEEIKG